MRAWAEWAGRRAELPGGDADVEEALEAGLARLGERGDEAIEVEDAGGLPHRGGIHAAALLTYATRLRPGDGRRRPRARGSTLQATTCNVAARAGFPWPATPANRATHIGEV